MKSKPRKPKRQRSRKPAANKKQVAILDLFGKIDCDPQYDYKRGRYAKRMG